MSSIAAEMGGSKGTLWSYSTSKEELFEAVPDDRTRANPSEVESLFDARDELRGTLRNFCRGILTKITSPQGLRLHRVIPGEAVRFPEIGRIFNERASLRLLSTLRTYLAEQMAAGKLVAGDPDLSVSTSARAC